MSAALALTERFRAGKPRKLLLRADSALAQHLRKSVYAVLDRKSEDYGRDKLRSWEHGGPHDVRRVAKIFMEVEFNGSFTRR